MNSLQKPCNYYDKYMKYKTKYIEYKNKLIIVNGKKRGGSSEGRSMLVGGGLNASIAFFSNNTFFANDSNVKTNIDHHIRLFYITNKNPQYTIYIIVTYILDNNAHIITYKIIKKVGSGTSGTVYKLEQIQPSPQSSLNNFVIKLNVLDKVEGKLTEIDKEGQYTDKLQIPYRSKALFQGNTCNIDFAIFNYLGQDLGTFLSKNSKSMTAEIILSLIKQLHEQLYSLNSNNYFHNDVKMQNIVVQKVSKINEETKTEYFEYVPSIIDYGLVTVNTSQMGTIESMCLYGCASFLLEKITEEEDEERKLLVAKLTLLQTITVSSDYVGFFNIIICLLNPNYCAYNIYYYILEINHKYTFDNLLNILCLLCYVSNSAKCDNFLAMSQCVKIVQKIDTKLEGTKIHMELFKPLTSDESPHMQRRLLFLCFIYSVSISNYGTGNVEFVHISKLPQFLLDISCCLDLRFNLEQFNANFGRIFNEKLLEPAPTQPTGQ
jgi:serine/threonine protein kinase